MEYHELKSEITAWVRDNQEVIINELSPSRSFKNDPDRAIAEIMQNLLTSVIPQIIAYAISIKDKK